MSASIWVLVLLHHQYYCQNVQCVDTRTHLSDITGVLNKYDTRALFEYKYLRFFISYFFKRLTIVLNFFNHVNDLELRSSHLRTVMIVL